MDQSAQSIFITMGFDAKMRQTSMQHYTLWCFVKVDGSIFSRKPLEKISTAPPWR